MADKTGIEWTDATWNPVTGCTKVSSGCKHCYAERDWARLSANQKTRYFDRAFTDVQCHADVLTLPLRWTKPRRIFVNSMSDLFHPDVPDRFIADVFGIMAAAREHTFQVLTKRPERALQLLGAGCMGRFESDVEECLALYSHNDLPWPLPNVWLGVSAEDQDTFDERHEYLLNTPAAVRFLSFEPLLGPIDAEFDEVAIGLEPDGYGNTAILGGIDWVIAGGESGPKARPMHPEWLASLRNQCKSANIPFLFKQWGEWAPGSALGIDQRCNAEERFVRLDGTTHTYADGEAYSASDVQMYRVRKKAAGRLLDGVAHDEYPEAAQ